MTQMSMGSNIAISVPAVRATLTWATVPGVPDVDASALLLEANGEVGSDADFVFYNQPEHFSGAVRMGGKTPAPQASASVDIDLSRVPADYQRVVLVASSDGGTFGQVPQLQMVLSDLASGQTIAAFPMQAGAETAFLSAEIYRRDGAWKFRAVGQGYSAGLAGLAADFGIDVGAAAEPGPEAPPAAPPTPPSAPPFSVGLDLSGDSDGVALMVPIVNDVPADFEQQRWAQPPTQQPPVQEPPVQPPPVEQAWSAPPAAYPPPAVFPPAPPPPLGSPPLPPPRLASPPLASPQRTAPPPPYAPVAFAPHQGISLDKNERADLTHSGVGPLTGVVFSLGWTPTEGRTVDLDASVIAFDADANKLAIVWYMHKNEYYGALQHTGDNRQGGVAGDAEQILIDLVRLPTNVTSLVFTINSFRKQTFTDVANAYCAVRDVDTGEPLVRFDLSSTQPSTAVLMAELRRSEQPGGWRVRAIGEFHDFRTVKKLVPAASRQVTIG
jgi:stress response protein SCP2